MLAPGTRPGIITISDLITDKMPPENMSSILALWVSSIYDKTGENHYIHPWTISNPMYYIEHRDEFVGWYPLQVVRPGDY